MNDRIFLLAISCLLLCNATAQTWSPPLEVPDYRGNGGVIGRYNSMAIVNGHPAIATLDDVHKMIRFVRANDPQGSSWGPSVFVNTPALDGAHLSLCVVNGRPAIAYQRAAGLDLMMVRANDADGTTWGAPVVVDQSGNVGEATSMAVVNGNPAISYYDATNNRLRYVRANDADGNSWGTPVNPELIVGLINSTTLVVVNGNPTIGFGRAGNTRYMRANDINGSSWGTGTTMVTGLDNGTFTSLAVVGGVPCMAYYKYEDERVAFRRANDPNGDTWGAEVTVHHVSGQLIGAYVRLFEVNGSPAVAYQHVTNFDLYYVRAANANGTSWQNHVAVDAMSNQGRDIAVHVVDGAPAIAYFDLTNGNLDYVRATNTTGMGAGAWPTPITMDGHPGIGDHMSQAIVEGFPALAYYSSTTRDLRYIRALDSLGTQWGTSITVDSIGDMGQYCSMAIVNGRPAIAYFDEDENVRYLRADDALGTTWGTSVSMDNSQSGPRGQGISLKVIGGRPAVAYLNFINGNIRYVRANDLDGSTWPTTGTTIGQVGGTIVQVSLAEVDGLPAVAYRTAVTNALMYERGGNVDWTGPGAFEVTVDATGVPGNYPSLVVVNGNPAIAYFDAMNFDLRYVRATAASGATWSTPLVVDTDGGTYTSMVVVNGHPAIAYRNWTMNTLDYVRASDVDGASWPTPQTLSNLPHTATYASMAVNGPYVGVAYQNLRRQQPWFVPSGGCAVDVGVSLVAQTLTADAFGAQYQWLDCLNSFAPINGATDQSFTPPNGVYAVEVRQGACADTSACVQVISTEIHDQEPAFIHLSPNPARDLLSVVATTGSSIATVSLIDARGRNVASFNATGDRMALELHTIPAGLYLLTATFTDNRSTSQRIVIARD